MKEDEAEKVFQELISLYDIADDLENNGEEEDAIQMRIKLNIIGEFINKIK
jgi:hypothetical protein